MYQIKLVVEPSPRPKAWARFLPFITFVESYWFAYRITVWNVGDEAVGENNVQKIEIIWKFRGEEETSRLFRFPKEIRPGHWATFGEGERLRVKTPGHARALVRLWILPGSHEPGVTDGNGKSVVVPNEGDFHFDTQDKQQYYVKELERQNDEFSEFWSASQTEVKQTLLIFISTLALLANVVIWILRR